MSSPRGYPRHARRAARRARAGRGGARGAAGAGAGRRRPGGLHAGPAVRPVDPDVQQRRSGCRSAAGRRAPPRASRRRSCRPICTRVALATTNNPRVRVVEKSMGVSALGRPITYSVVGTPDNIANLDAGRNDAGVLVAASARARSRPRTAWRRSAPGPAFAWVTATPHGNEPAAGEASMRLLYELAARTGLRQRAQAAEPRHVHRAGHQPGRARPQPRAPRPGALIPTATAARASTRRTTRFTRGDRQVPGRVRHRRPSAGQRVLLPAQRGRASTTRSRTSR